MFNNQKSIIIRQWLNMASIGLNIKIPKDSLINLKHYENSKIVVKFNAGRIIEGTLKSWDKGLNMILDNACEVKDNPDKSTNIRELGLAIIKGSQIYSVCAKDGYLMISNPFQQGQQQQKNTNKQQQ